MAAKNLSQCAKCGGKCCKYFCFEIDEPTDYEEFEDIRWYILHKGATVHLDEGDWYISIENRCKALDKENRCTIYDERPLICRQYTEDDCDHTMGDYGYTAEFKTPEDVEEYARKVLGKAKFDDARDAARKKLDGKAKEHHKHMMETRKHRR